MHEKYKILGTKRQDLLRVSLVLFKPGFIRKLEACLKAQFVPRGGHALSVIKATCYSFVEN
jgi:hypothetical protein